MESDKTILAVDDSKTMQKIVELTFRATPFKVVSAESAEDAKAKISSDSPDVILLDSNIPGADAYALCDELKSDDSTKHIPVLFLASKSTFDEGRASNANGHISKPFETQSLIDQVKQLTGLPVEAHAQPMTFAEALAAKQRASQAPAAGNGAAAAGVPSAPPDAIESAPPSAPPDAIASAPPEAAAGFGAPEQEAAPVEEAPVAADEPPEDDVPESVESAEARGPALEPPTRPTEEERAEAAKVDMWSLADQPAAEAHRAPSAPPPKAPSAPPPASQIADIAAPGVAAAASAAVPGVPKEELVQVARQVIEEIAWEVVPDLAETIIREEIRRLLAQ